MSSIRVLRNQQLAPFMKRHMQPIPHAVDARLDEFLRLALEKANEFVPSECGSIFLDDPSSKDAQQRTHTSLAAVACFGPKSSRLLGRRLSVDHGIVGRVYASGYSYYSPNARKDPNFSREFDMLLGYRTRSILCVPISIRGSRVGVLQLINKEGKGSYTIKDFELLKIFADYISASIQNFLDAKRNAAIAKQDNLTGLSNDRQFHDSLKKEVAAAWRAKRELALLFIDLDHFKEINDEHGHLAGSRVLFEVAGILRQTVKWRRAEIARYGGDEYVVILPGAGVVDAMSIAEDVRRAIERHVFLSSNIDDVPALEIADQVTASVGVACLQKHVGANDRNRLLKAADDAMYSAKRSGKNKVSLAGRSERPKPELNQ